MLIAVAPLRALAAQGTGLRLAVAADTSLRHMIRLRDGSTILGRVADAWGDSARIASTGGQLVVHREDVVAVRLIPATLIRDGAYWPDQPNATRLFFAPTGRTLRKGQRSFANRWLFTSDFHAGITDRFTLGGAVIVPPVGEVTPYLIAAFLSPKLALYQSASFNSAVGVMIGGLPFLHRFVSSGSRDGINPNGLAYGAATWGSMENSITATGAYFMVDGRRARQSVIMLGATRRLSRTLSFVTENWLAPARPALSAGIRTIGRTITWDLGVFTANIDHKAWLVPWIGMAVTY